MIAGWRGRFVFCLRGAAILSMAGITEAIEAELLEKKTVAFLYCCEVSVYECQRPGTVFTSRTPTRSSMICQSSESNSNRRNFMFLSAVTWSIALQYISANAIMSWVEFHRVTTSRGISRALRSSVWQVRRHAGRAMVVEWMIAKANLRSYIGGRREYCDKRTRT